MWRIGKFYQENYEAGWDRWGGGCILTEVAGAEASDIFLFL